MGSNMFAAELFYQLVSCLQKFGSVTPFFHFTLLLCLSGQTGSLSGGITTSRTPGASCVCHGASLHYQGLFHRDFLDNPISISGFCWDGWGRTRLIYSKSHPWDWILWPFNFFQGLAKDRSATPLAFSPEHVFLRANLLVLASFAIWTG